MTSNLVRKTNVYVTIPMQIIDQSKRTWLELVEQKIEKDLLVDITCQVYSTSDEDLGDETKQCPCGRLVRSHSFVGEAQTRFADETEFDEENMAHFYQNQPLRACGRLGITGNDARFIRCYSGLPDIFETLSDLVIKEMGYEPDLLISCYGGASNFAMTDKLEKEFMNGISRAAVTKGVWLLTTGLNQGISKLIGHSVHRFNLLNKNSSKPTIIGLNSWGVLTEQTQKVLKYQTSRDVDKVDYVPWDEEDSSNSLNWNEHNTLDKYHSHFLLLDDGRMNVFLDDRPRTDFVQAMCSKTNCRPITIIIEGGTNTLQVIRNDLEKKRPVVIIHGSGRLASLLGTLLEISSTRNTLENSDIEQQMKLFLPDLHQKHDADAMKGIIDSIKEVLQMKHRTYLNIFKLERDTSVTDTIIRALDRIQSDAVQNNLLRLAVSWNYLQRAQNMPKHSEDDPTLYPSLFKQALIENRPIFVDYFLRRYYNPLVTTTYNEHMKTLKNQAALHRSCSSTVELRQKQSESCTVTEEELRVACALSLIIDDLYHSLEAPSDRWKIPETVQALNENYMDLIGPYVKSFYFRQNVSTQLRSKFKKLSKRIDNIRGEDDESWTADQIKRLCEQFSIDTPFNKREMLRELFLWSVYGGYSDIAFVLLLQMESRISAALIAASIAQRLSLFANHLDLRRTFAQQTKEYEEYARDCVTACYKHNERLACQLVVRENRLFGDVTCMQIAIASNNIPFINTSCCNELLNRQWFGQFTDKTSGSANSAVRFIISLLTLGLTAPYLMKYRQVNTTNITNQDNSASKLGTDQGSRRWKGIEDQTVESPNNWQKLLYFHSAPVVKICYHFAVYVWFLLVFSYVILFRMRDNNNLFHWTKIYLLITVSAMLLEDFRQVVVDRYTQMVEKSDMSSSWMVAVRALAYILFYIGIMLHFRSAPASNSFAIARIILAIDLELWFLFSLRFVSAIRLLGPKLIMVQGMVRDLMAFLYIIFVCIITYGVVSRALTHYTTLSFTATSILRGIFYQPYWFLHSIIDNEKQTLDDTLSHAETLGVMYGAVINHILMVLHMVIINILILNLLIAVFNFSINDVQEKNEFYWRYQRYALICEYFQKPHFAYPPLSLLAYIGWLINVWVFRGPTFRVFKYLRRFPEMDNHWTEFENAATYEHARDFVEEHYRSKDTVTFSTLQAQIELLQDENERIWSNTDEIKNRLSADMEHIKQTLVRINSSTT